MRKKIEFPPYEEAEVKAVLEDGSILCDLYGEKAVDESGKPYWRYRDTDIVFPAGSEILDLTEEEKSELEAELLNTVNYEESI